MLAPALADQPRQARLQRWLRIHWSHRPPAEDASADRSGGEAGLAVRSAVALAVVQVVASCDCLLPLQHNDRVRVPR